MNIGEKIKKLRLEKFMTQAELAKQLGITRSSVNAWEMGISVPSTQYIVELAHTIPGAIGARLSGGGFGGITIHLVKAEDAAAYAERIAEAFAVKFKVRAETILCDIGEGASLVFP